MYLLAPLCIVLLLALPAAASPEKATYYLDGARIESEAAAVNGQLDIRIPQGTAAGSLRLKPLQGASITRVEFTEARSDRKVEAEIARLTGRIDALVDRLKALEVKEEIFRSAAKSQSAKSPRSTKNNREPLENIRRGTDFAITQLEDVYRAQRKAEYELKTARARLLLLKDTGNIGGRIARVWLAGKNGRVAISYLNPGLKWTPVYDFRLNSGEVEVTMHALLPGIEKGRAIAVAPALLSENSAEPPIAIAPGGPAKVEVFRFPLEKENYSSLPNSSFSFVFTNRSGKRMPPGESTCYRQGEFIGKARFEGSLPGESKSLEFGKAVLTAK
jgi:hypothetical protein